MDLPGRFLLKPLDLVTLQESLPALVESRPFAPPPIDDERTGMLPGSTNEASPTANVLLVDDNPANLLALEAILDSPTHRLLQASRGQDAITISRREELAVILLDVRMPGMDGLEVARVLKEDKATRHIPIIFVTAVETEVQHVYAAYSAGAVDYLVKPLDRSAVRQKVATFVELFLQRKEIQQQAEALRIAERREFELKLKELKLASDERYRKLVRGIDHVLAWSADAALNLTFVSEQASRILGYPLAAFSEPGFFERCVHPEERALLLGAVGEAIASGTDQACNHRMMAADGRALWFHTGVSAEETAGGPVALHGISTDVSDLKRGKEVHHFLSSASTHLAHTIEHRPMLGRLAELVVPFLADWCVVDTVGENPTILHRRDVGHPDPVQRDALSRALERRGPFDPSAQCAMAEVLRTGRSVLRQVTTEGWDAEAFGQESELLRALGATSYMIVPLRARGRTLAVMSCISSESRRHYTESDLALAQDLAHRAALAADNGRLFDEAQSATRSRELLLAVVSHDLRSFLQTIAFASARLEYSADDLAKRTAKTIGQVSHQMNRLLDDLLDVEKVERNLLTLVLADHGAASLVRHAIELLEPQARERSIRLVGETDDVGLLKVHCDRDRVLQVFFNLVGNALKFSPPETTVTLRASPRDSFVEFFVVDEGAGIAADRLPHVFERYWRASESSQRRSGLGLGLAIVKGIVVAHGGTVRAESEIGRGSVFSFTLPGTHAGETPAGKPAAPDE